MKILFFRESESDNINPKVIKEKGFGATETSFVLLAQELSKKNEVKVICPNNENLWFDNVEYIPFKNYNDVIEYSKNFKTDVFIVVANPKILLNFFIDVKQIIFWHHNHPLTVKHFNIISLFKKYPFIKFVFPSPEACELGKLYYQLHENFFGIYNGVRNDIFKPNKKQKGRIVFNGSLTRVQGANELIKASIFLKQYEIIICSGFDLYVVEDKEYKKACEQELEKNSLTITGSLNPYKLSEYVSSAEICIVNPLINNKETCCVSALESMACKTFVIAGGRSTIDPIIKHGGFSYIENLVKTIEYFMGDYETREKIAENGYNWVQNLSWEKIALKWEKIIGD